MTEEERANYLAMIPRVFIRAARDPHGADLEYELSEGQATALLRARESVADDLAISVQHAINIIEQHVPRDALGVNAQGDPDVPGGYQAWPLLDEYLHDMRASLAKYTQSTGLNAAQFVAEPRDAGNTLQTEHNQSAQAQQDRS